MSLGSILDDYVTCYSWNYPIYIFFWFITINRYIIFLALQTSCTFEKLHWNIKKYNIQVRSARVYLFTTGFSVTRWLSNVIQLTVTLSNQILAIFSWQGKHICQHHTFKLLPLHYSWCANCLCSIIICYSDRNTGTTCWFSLFSVRKWICSTLT